jgi:protein-S-isoprenylcysteine O-methyltransferase Ste14
MYIGVILVLIGEAIFFQSISLWLYSFGIFIVFNCFIFFLEEPRLRKDFKEEYDEYCKKARRWV